MNKTLINVLNFIGGSLALAVFLVGLIFAIAVGGSI